MQRHARFVCRLVGLTAACLPTLAWAQDPADLAGTATATELAESGTLTAELPAEATDSNAMTLAISLVGRVTGQYTSGFRIDPAGNTSPAGTEYSTRIRVRADAETKEGDHRWSVAGSINVDAIDGTLAGGPDASLGDKLPGSAAESVILQDAYVGVRYGKVFGVRVGAMTSQWGLGLVANDGANGMSMERNDWFSLTRASDRNLRLLVHTMPWANVENSPLRGLMFLGALDKVLDDDTASSADGQNAQQVVAAARMYVAERQWFGLYYVRRWQHHDDNATLNPGKDLRVHVVDAALDFDFRDKATRQGLRLEAEAAGIIGDTSLSPTPEFPRHDINQVGAFGRATWVGVANTGLTLQFDTGYFSGDANVDDGKVSTFHADRNLKQGLLLFDRVLAWQTGRARRTASDPGLVGVPAQDLDRLASGGSVFDAITVYPKVGYRVLDWLEVYGGALLAWAPAPLVDPLHTRTDTGGVPVNFAGTKAEGRYLATEIDLGVRATWRLADPWKAAVQVGLEQGILLPGGALGTLTTQDNTDNHAYATRLTVSLLGR
jgi:hypothetical protein